ncbi:hypothetical protein OROGR_007602 [Orobanche gracilis]
MNNKIGPDFFGFYTSQVAELLSKDEDLLPFSPSISHSVENVRDEVGKDKGLTKNNITIENKGTNGYGPLFSNGIGALLSEFKSERLKYLLRQSVFTLTKEVDEQCPEIDDDLRFLLESDTTKVEELMIKESDEFSVTLHHMEQKLEELLNILMTSCSCPSEWHIGLLAVIDLWVSLTITNLKVFSNRPMTLAEKQQLRRSIQNLPPRNLDRVVEIIGSSKPPSDKYSRDEVHVDLGVMENATLWRLYFYVRAMEASTI